MLKLSIYSPERRLLENREVNEVTLPGSEGQIQVLPGHVAMVGTLDTGLFSYQVGQEIVTGVISSGFFEVRDDRIGIMAETIELTGEIDVARARIAQKRAEAALQEAEFDEHKFKKYQLKLQRSLIRQQLAEKQH